LREGRASLEDVARRAGVSLATASRALGGSKLVRAETVARVTEAAESLRYLPGGAARALASGRTMTVGAVVPTLDHAIFSRAIQAMQTTLAASGYQLLVSAHDYVPKQEADAVRAMLSRGVDAIMVVGADHLEETWELLSSSSVPVALSWSFDDRFDSIGFDNELAGRLAGEHLLELGHRRFGMISGRLGSNDRARMRVAGFRSALEDKGVALAAADLVEQPFTLAGGRAGLALLLDRPNPPSAILCGNDLLAVGALLEAQRRGVAVPGDLSLCGIDDLEIAGHVTPALTTIRLPTAELGTQVASHLLARLSGETPPRRVCLNISLVRRASTGPDGMLGIREVR
jgi:LacI family transcriptional regulator